MTNPRLLRSENDKIFAGVAGGIATYLGIDPVFVRLAFILLFFASGVGGLLYLVLMIVMPSERSADLQGSQIVQDNISKFGDDINSSIKRARKHPQGRILGAGLLIALGVYLMLNNLGLFHWLRGDLLFALAFIGLGLYLLVRRA